MQTFNGLKNVVFLRLTRNNRTGIRIYVRNVVKPGRYSLSFDTSDDTAYTSTQNFGLYYINGRTIDDPNYNYITTSKYVGYVNFTIADTLTKKIAGTFEFEGIDSPSSKNIKITDGRFDIDPATLNP